MIELPALYLFLSVLLSSQILIFISIRQNFEQVIFILDDLLASIDPPGIEGPEIKAMYQEGYKAGILEQTRRKNEEFNTRQTNSTPAGEEKE